MYLRKEKANFMQGKKDKFKNVKISKYNLEIPFNDKMIVFNSVTNSYAFFEQNDYRNFKNNIENYLSIEDDKEKINALWEGHFLISDPEMELLKIKNDFFTKAYNSSVFNATIIPTNACNLACPYCFAERTEDTMSKETVKRVIVYFEKLFENIGDKLKHFNVKWFGGEPLLCIKQIETISLKLIELCENAGIEYHACIYTNLTLLNEKILQKLLNSRISSVYTTIDSVGNDNDLRRPAKNGKLYFETLIRHIKRIKEVMEVNILTNIDKKNQNKINHLIDYLTEQKIVDGNNSKIGFNLINDNEYIINKDILIPYNEPDTERMINSFLVRLGKYASVSLPTNAMNCFAMANNTVVIDPVGNLKKCSLGKPYGSIYREYYNVNKEKYFFSINNPFEKKECVECPVFPVCYGGCVCNDVEICTIKYLLETKIRRFFEVSMLEGKNENSNY